VDFIYSVYPCLVKPSRGSILLLWSFYTLFTLCPFETKRGSICLIWTGIVFLTGQVIFVPEWPKGEFISFCVGCILLDKITSM
jgi:predicted membrane channel-forming protein YqfA (hemolysin III family)